MRDYEAMLVLQPELEDGAVNELIERVADVVRRGGGEVGTVGQIVDRKGRVAVVEEGGWGKRRLAYPIRGHVEGYYSVLKLQLPPESVDEVESALRINEDVLRYLIVRNEADEPAEEAD